MGLADRFKDKLETKNIFTKSEIEKTFEENDIKFISKSPEADVPSQPEVVYRNRISPVRNVLESDVSDKTTEKDIQTKFEDLETEIISKIRKTPYWDEYSAQRQEKMISCWFDIKTSKFRKSAHDKTEFVQNILTLSNNR